MDDTVRNMGKVPGRVSRKLPLSLVKVPKALSEVDMDTAAILSSLMLFRTVPEMVVFWAWRVRAARRVMVMREGVRLFMMVIFVAAQLNGLGAYFQ